MAVKQLKISYSQDKEWIQTTPNSAVVIDNVYFSGKLTIRINQHNNDPYFRDKKRLYAIEFAGQFKQAFGGDDLMMAADFERELTLPLGIGIMQSFVKLIDPALEMALKKAQPYVQSPVLCAFNSVGSSNDAKESFTENLSTIFNLPFEADSYSKRRKYFLNVKTRKAFDFDQQHHFQFEWYSPYVNFNTFEVFLGFRHKFHKQLNGQPVVFSCRSRDSTRVVFQIKFELE